MCGIAAIIDPTQEKTVLLKSMLETIRHRGDKEHFAEMVDLGECSMGINRMAIVDRGMPGEVISAQDGRYRIVLNGEIYNYLELQSRLKEAGHVFSTNSDTEVLLHAYMEWGERMFEEIRGMFAFFIYDDLSKDLFVARDPFGVKPLYWAKTAGGVYYFGSEIKSLAFLDDVETIDLFPPASYMFKGELHTYWQIPEADPEIGEEEAVARLRALFDESLKKRVQTDLPVAVYLSGGIDSTAVLATARKFNQNVTAIILGVEGSSDRLNAVRYCEENDIPYFVGEPPSEEDMAKQVPEFIAIAEGFEPNLIRGGLTTYYIAKLAAEKGFKVILCGEGADELFAGYPEFKKCTNGIEVEALVKRFTADLHRTQLQRIDRCSMHFTTELREPFLDVDFADLALRIPGDLKIRKDGDKVSTKYIFRKAMEDRLPEYIYNRDKVVMMEGMGLKGNEPGGLIDSVVSKEVGDAELEASKNKYPDWNLNTREEVYYFRYFVENRFDKFSFAKNRVTANRSSSVSK